MNSINAVNRMKLIGICSFLTLAVLSFSISASDYNCDSLRIQNNILNRNLRTELFTTAGIGLVTVAVFGITVHTDMKTIDKNTYAVWGVAIGLPIGALTVTTVGAIKKLKFKIQNRNKCKEYNN